MVTDIAVSVQFQNILRKSPEIKLKQHLLALQQIYCETSKQQTNIQCI